MPVPPRPGATARLGGIVGNVMGAIRNEGNPLAHRPAASPPALMQRGGNRLNDAVRAEPREPTLMPHGATGDPRPGPADPIPTVRGPAGVPISPLAAGPGLLGNAITGAVNWMRGQPMQKQNFAKRADPQEDALKLLGMLGAAGLGTGAAARGAMGLHEQLTAPTYDPLMYSSSVPTPIPVPIMPAKKKPESRFLARLLPGESPTAAGLPMGEEDLPKAAWAKRAFGESWKALAPQAMPPVVPPRATPPQPSLFSQAAHAIVPPGVPPQAPLSGTWGIPAAVLATGGGLVGGWKLMDMIGGKNKKQVADEAEDKAHADYQQALAEQYRAAMRAKKGSPDDLGIDDLYELLTKVAQQPGLATPAAPPAAPPDPGTSFLPLPSWYTSLRGMTTALPQAAANGINTLRGQPQADYASPFWGAVDAATLAGGLGAGYMTYNWVKGRGKDKVLEKAVQQRARQRQFTPAPFMAVPESIQPSEN